RNSFNAFWRSHPFLYTHINPYSQTAVIVFFVLSGFVIAHVLATRERSPLEYVSSRFGRLYSVVVPALILTAAANYSIELKFPAAFASYGDSTMMVLRYLATSVYVNRFWMPPDLEPANAPFWSLSFEVVYYAGIALFVFVRGPMRWPSLVLLCLLAGP